MADTTASGTDLSSFYDQRYIKHADLLTTFNPQHLKASGYGAPGIGGDPAATGPFYVFVTTPDCNILEEGARKYHRIGAPTAPEEIAKLLTGGAGFIKILTNLTEQFGVQDISLDTYNVGEGWDGAKLTVPKSTLNSRQNGTVQLELMEFAGLPITNLHRLWVDYVEAVTKGILSPKTSTPNYITQKLLDYACSIYYFSLLPDARTIEFGVRFTGCFPTAVPYSAFNGKIGMADAVKVTVPYAFAYMEPMDPMIFDEFNTSAGSSGVKISQATLQQSQRKAYVLDFSEGKTLDGFL
jgi:hypothetical protein